MKFIGNEADFDLIMNVLEVIGNRLGGLQNYNMINEFDQYKLITRFGSYYNAISEGLQK